jgi:AP-2 complex subunit mu-1
MIYSPRLVSFSCLPAGAISSLPSHSHTPVPPPPLFSPLQVPPTTANVNVVVGIGRAKYEPEKNAVVWRVKRFPGGSEVVLNGEILLIASTKNKAWARPPIAVDFQVPMFTASGLHVRSLKIYERSNYQTTKWVRYVTRAGSYQIRT